jgi:hypothetical protein
VLLETHGILRILSTPCTGPYPVTNLYKNGTIRIQKVIVSEIVNITSTFLKKKKHEAIPYNFVQESIAAT